MSLVRFQTLRQEPVVYALLADTPKTTCMGSDKTVVLSVWTECVILAICESAILSWSGSVGLAQMHLTAERHHVQLAPQGSTARQAQQSAWLAAQEPWQSTQVDAAAVALQVSTAVAEKTVARA